MVVSDNGMPKGHVIGNVDPSLISKDTHVVAPVREVGTEAGRDFAGKSVERVKHERVRCGGSVKLLGKGGIKEVDEQCVWEESDSLIVRVDGGYMVQSVRESVRSTEVFAGNVFEGKIKFS